MMHKRNVITSWPISFFWVFLSIAMAILATYSFLQADWVIKRNLVVTNYYQPPDQQNSTNSHTVLATLSPASSRGRSDSPYFKKHNETISHSQLVNILTDNYKQYSRIKGGDDARPGMHVRRVIKVTKVVTTIRFGTIGVCTSVSSVVQCKLYSNHDRYPVSSIWSMVTIIGGSGCMTLCVSAVLSLLAVALPSSQLRHQVATTIGHAQTVAVVLLFLSLLLFPLGFDSDFVRYHCGVFSGPYNIADCEIGWAYALVLVCASLALYCPVLVKFTADIRYDALPKYL
ncbi:unnamed protein product [Allacma fusca]|uniref:Uncharacterized protein n=1 Tax=Allacma fusca TaxID=39272 RepID=A0A8J2KYC1_9HEXA|nr:unnamed protein product [Allacma fusca]